MNPTIDELRPLMEAVEPDLNIYRKSVSGARWAVSLETAALIEWACVRNDPVTVCDLGSGFTSWVLRRYAVGRGVACTSVDTESKWLAKSKAFLYSHGLDATDCVSWADWRARSDLYDLIVVDMAYGPLRNEAIREAPGRLNPGGVIVFDDAQPEGNHLPVMESAASEHNLRLRALEQLTDNFGRFPAVAW